MTRVEYMQHLEQALKGYDREFIQEIVENYNEHFETGLKDGRTEEEICQELGNVEGLLKDIQELMGDRDIQTHEVDKFTAVVEQKEQYNGISKVELELSYHGVKVYPSNDGQLHVYLEDGEEKSKYLEEQISGDSYFARAIDLNKQQSSKNILSMILNRGIRNEDITVIVETPKELASLTIKTMSGDIDVRRIFAKALKLEAMSGDVYQQDMQEEEAIVKTMSGDITLKNVDGKDIVVSDTSGDVTWKNVGVEEAEIKTISGDVALENVRSNRVNVKTTSGDVCPRGTEIGDLTVNTTSGDISGSFFAEKITMHSISGDIDLTVDRHGRELVAKGKTVSGDFRVYGASECVGEPDPERYITASFSTVSGDVRVR